MTAKETSTIDLASLDTVKASNEGCELELRHPATKKALGQFITILGPDNDRLKELRRERADAQIAKRLTSVKSGKDVEPLTAEQVEEQEIELLAACTIGFRGINWGGSEFKFTIPNAMKLYRTFPWIKDQVNSGIADISNFIKG
jgi:hypothetical protein